MSFKKLINLIWLFIVLNSYYVTAQATTIESKLTFVLSQSETEITHLYKSISVTEEGQYDLISKNGDSDTYSLDTQKNYRIRASVREFQGSGTTDPFENVDHVLNGNQIASTIKIPVDSSLVEVLLKGPADAKASVILSPLVSNGGIRTLKKLTYENKGPMYFLVKPGEYELYVKRGFSEFPATTVSANKGESKTVTVNTEFSELNLTLDWSSLQGNLSKMPIELTLYLLEDVETCSARHATNASKAGSLQGQIEENFRFEKLVLPATYCVDIKFKRLLDGTTPEPFDFEKRRQLLKFSNLEVKINNAKEQNKTLTLKSNQNK